MGTTVQGTGLFVEAAYGPDGMPGQGSVSAEGASTDFKSKMDAAEAAIQAALSPSQVSSDLAFLSVDPGLPVMASPGVKDSHPVSWDRLSMTVASMVAWNMQVGMSDDIPAEVITPGSTLSSEGAVLLGSGEFEPTATLSDAQLGPPSVLTSGAGLSVSALSADFNDGMQDGPSAANSQASAGTLDVEGGGDSGLPFGLDSIAPTVIREGAETHPSQVGAQGLPAASFAEVSIDGAPGQAATATQAIASTIMKADSAVTVTEIPTSLPSVTGSLGESADAVSLRSGSSPVVHSHSSGADRPGLEQISRVHSSTVDRDRIDAGLRRLAGVRSVLAELETTATVRTTVAAVQQSVMGVGTAGQIATEAATGLQQKASKLAVSTSTPSPALSAHRARADKGGLPVGDDLRTFGTVGDDARLERPLGPLSSVAAGAPPQVGAAIAGTAQVDTPVMVSAADLSSVIVGSENAKISSDLQAVVNTLAVDAKTIEASEVPELPVTDPSQIDFDVDDPAGSVRVVMSREAEGVTIRVQTPAEVLEEYREMEDDLDRAVAGQGLELSEFSASTHGESDGTDPDTLGHANPPKDSGQGGLDSDIKGAQTLEQSGTVSRLVNHIV
jgi:hypothetical protein